MAGTLLVDPRAVLVRWGVVCGPGVLALRGGKNEVRRASAAARFAMKVVAAASVTAGGAPCWPLLPPGPGWLAPNVVEDVLGGSGPRCRCGARLGLRLGFVCGLPSRRAYGFGWLLGGGLGFRPGCGRGLRRGSGLGGSGVARGGDGFGSPFKRFPPRLRGWSAGRGRGGGGG